MKVDVMEEGDEDRIAIDATPRYRLRERLDT